MNFNQQLTKMFFLLFSLILFVSACGGSINKLAVSPTSSLQKASSPELTTTTTMSKSSNSSTSLVEIDIVTTTTIDPLEWFGPQHPLTGMPAPDGQFLRPALAVKVGNNDVNSLPQEGLEAADIVYEAIIEAGKTRFLAVFQSSIPVRVAPVRSARSTDISLIGNLSNPYFAYWGSNEGVGAEVAEAESRGTFVPQSAEVNNQEAFARDPARGQSPYDGTLTPASLMAASSASVPISVFEYGEISPTAIPALGIRWLTDGRSVEYLWDKESEKWNRFQDGNPMFDSYGSTLSADNVVVLYVDYSRSKADPNSPQAQSTGSGDGWLLRDGRLIGLIWERQFEASRWSFFDDQTGEIVKLAPGRTWVSLAQLGQTTVLSPIEAALLSGK